MLGISWFVEGEVMKSVLNRRSAAALVGLALLWTKGAAAQTTASTGKSSDIEDTYSAVEVIAAGHKFFVPVTAKGKHARVQVETFEDDIGEWL